MTSSKHQRQSLCFYNLKVFASTLPNTVIDYNASLPLYIQNSKSEICYFSFFSKTLIPNSSFCHISLISCPNHSPQSPNFIFFHSLSHEPIEISNDSLKWRNHQRSERVLRVEANDIPRLKKLRFLPPFPLPHCSHSKNNGYGTQIFSLLVPLLIQNSLIWISFQMRVFNAFRHLKTPILFLSCL